MNRSRPASIDTFKEGMTMDELSQRSLDLCIEFSRYTLEHPRFAEKIPHGAQVVLLPKYDKELREYNLRNAKINAEPECPVVHIEISQLRPRRSLIVRPQLKVTKQPSANGKQTRKKRTAPLF
jgi:hypothetical protein